ncbi:hypothetical protein E4U42_000594 [Claviceps africana]|uniref:Nodulin-like domain-containing protein n=1 Tax=Claviceps africana TaxID=83212 RepID=A0A8K0JAI2_9HYPO|nr:hypothetical protein E4U42_000594 [Claviceps africana]
MGRDRQQQLRLGRLIASVAATMISLACGTNFAEKLKLSATQSNMIGQAGNLGMYSLGVPVGILVDRRGPRPFVIIGAILLVAGYFPLHVAYKDGAFGSVATLCFFSFLTGLGSCMAFAAAVKTSALNWPFHRGTATAFPLAAFGLSAFFFSSLGALFFPGDSSAFLKLLSCGTFGLIFAGFFFLRVYPQPGYHAVTNPGSRLPSFSNQSRTSQDYSQSPHHHPAAEPGTSSITASVATPTMPSVIHSEPTPGDTPISNEVADEDSSLLSPTLSENTANVEASNVDTDRTRHVDIRGLKLLRNQSFWLLFTIMAILSGVGLMTIKYVSPSDQPNSALLKLNIGNDVNMHVSILSLCSFGGRLLSGVGSDFLARSLRASRVWCLLVASAVFLVSQACALFINDPHFLGLVSGLSGLGYGFLFGVFPSLVTEAFGIRGLSQNWGFMTLAPVISSNIFNSVYGAVLDSHSVFDPSGERSCHVGLECYRAAYWITFFACSAGIVIALWAVRHERAELARGGKRGGRIMVRENQC